MEEEEWNPEKFRQLLLYVAKKSERDPFFGAVKLNKILYFSDFNAFRRLGHSITGADYQRLPEGPAPRKLLPERQILLERKAIEVEERPFFNHIQQRIVAKVDPDLTAISEAERAIVDEVIDVALAGKNGREASDESHAEIGWQLFQNGESIPYRTAWYSPGPISLEGIEAAKKAAQAGIS